MKTKHLLIILLLNFIIGCKSTQSASSNANKTECQIPIREHTIQALLWQQQSAEYKALCYQAFNIAKIQVDQASKNNYIRPIAIVTDIDETVLDNSPYNARMVKNDKNYTSGTWYGWGKEQNAKTVPGALEFFNYANSKGIAIFYVSNRKDLQKKETIANLKKVGFPNVNDKTVILKTTTSSKKERRDAIKKKFDIFMLIGDNLSDFSEKFDDKSTKERNITANLLKSKFGFHYIVLPNPMYGDWETKGIYNNNYNWTDKQKDSIRKSKMRLK